MLRAGSSRRSPRLNNLGLGAGTSTIAGATSFYAPLTNNLSAWGLGSTTPTFSRASTAYVRDHENVERQALANEARFWGARRVRNLFAQTENWISGTWVKSSVDNSLYNQTDRFGGTSAAKVVPNNGAAVTGNDGIGGFGQNLVSVVAVGNTVTVSVEAKAGEAFELRIRESTTTGRRAVFNLITGTITYENSASATNYPAAMTSLGNGWWRCSVTYITASVNTNFTLKGCGAGTSTTGDGVSGLYIAFPQEEDVTGQSVQTPSEYVSTNVLSAPYQGANVDGVQYFDSIRLHTQNACPRSEDLGNVAWAPVNWVATESTMPPPAAVPTAKVFEYRDDTTNTAHRVAINPTGATFFSPGSTWEFSAYIQAGYMDEFNIRIADLAFTATGRYGITSISGMTGFTTVTGGGTCTGSIVDAGNNWRLVTVRFTFPLSVANNVGTLLMYPTFDVRAYAGTGQITSYICAPSCRKVSAAILSTYVPTQSVSVGPTDTGTTALIPNTTLKKFVREAAVTQLCPQPTAYSNVAWAKTDIAVGPTDNSVVAPSGELTASQWTEGSAGTAALGCTSTPAYAAGSSVAVSTYMRLGPSAPQQWVQLTVQDTVTPADVVRAWFNLATGAVGAATVGGAASGQSARITVLSGGWYRCEVTVLLNALSTQAVVQIISADANSSTVRVNGSIFQAWVTQVEVFSSAGATSPIPTAVTRSADSLTYPLTGNFSNAEGTAYGELSAYTSASNSQNVVYLGNITNYEALFTGAVGGTGRAKDGTNTATSTGGTTWPAVPGTKKFASSWGALGLSAAAQGGSGVGTSAYVGTFGGTNTVLNIGGNGSATAPANGGVGNIRIYNRKVTDAELAAMVA